jgi:hypothetical protein
VVLPEIRARVSRGKKSKIKVKSSGQECPLHTSSAQQVSHRAWGPVRNDKELSRESNFRNINGTNPEVAEKLLADEKFDHVG